MKSFVFTLFIFFGHFTQGFSQNKENAFYLLSQEKQHLDDTSDTEQMVALSKDDVLINEIGMVKDSTLTLTKAGTYSVSGYICVNPGIYGKTPIDYVSLRVVLRYSTDQFKTSTLISSQTQNYLYGNLSVSEQIQTPERILSLPKGAQIRWFVQKMSHSTVALNASYKYAHIDPPTGLLHSKALRLKKLE